MVCVDACVHTQSVLEDTGDLCAKLVEGSSAGNFVQFAVVFAWMGDLCGTYGVVHLSVVHSAHLCAVYRCIGSARVCGV